MDQGTTHTLVHGTCVALEQDGRPVGVLLRGVSGSGKSDLALRLIDRGARLVADDQCEIGRHEAPGGPYLVARAPAAIAGRIEVRGVGIVEVPVLSEVRLALVVDLTPPADIERLPAETTEALLGVALPRLSLDPSAPSAPAKLRTALQARARASVSSPPSTRAPGGSGNGARRRLVLITGLSGAGHSTALKTLEDLGYEAIDNLPLNHLRAVLTEGERGRPLAVGIDIRNRRFAAETVIEHFDDLAVRPRLDVTLVFLDSEDEVLTRRFTETRRRHPLARDRRVADGISLERRLVAPLRERADVVVDTSDLSIADLRRVLSGHFALDKAPGMSIFVTSFSFRNGLPREADLVFDVRFLANPHYVPTLRALDGRDPHVAAYVEADPSFAGFFEGVTALLAPLLPRYEQEGKSYLTIAFGCTGGQHRSVALAERLAGWIRDLGRPVSCAHRDLPAPATDG